MDYGHLIRQSWELTWRYRYLWIIGLFATSTVGSCTGNVGGSGSGWQTNAQEMDRVVPGSGEFGRSFGLWVSENAAAIVGLALLAFLIGLGVFLVTMIAQGAMAEATLSLARGRRNSAGEAWRAGLHYFWRYLALWLLMLAIGIAVAILLAIPAVAAAVLFAVADSNVRTVLLVLGGLLMLAFLLLIIPVAIGAAIVVAYAQRAIVAENIGPLAALGAGFRLLRAHLGQSLIAWLVNLALSIGAGLIFAAAAVVVLIPLGAIAAILFNSTGFSPTIIAYGVVAGILFGLIMWLLAGITNTYFWNYWTLIYLRLTQQLPAGTEPPAPAAQ